MEARQFRNLTVRQLAKASAESWNDAMALAEILTELRRRAPDTQIDTLIRSNVRRLSTLTYRPIDQADAEQVASEDGRPVTVSRRQRRRRVLIAALFSGAAAGVMAVLLLPPREPPATPAENRSAGLQVSGTMLAAAPVPTAPGADPPGVPYRAEPRAAEPRPRPGEPRPPERTNLAAVEAATIRVQTRQADALYAAEVGIRLTPQQFQCFVGSADPRRCDAEAPQEVERVGAQPHARAPVEPYLAPARLPVPSPAMERDLPVRARAEDSLVERALAVAARAGQPASPAPAQNAAEPDPAPEASACSGTPSEGRLVFVMDGSLSMGLPADLDPAIEDRLDEDIRNQSAEARQQYRTLLAEPGPKRMSRAGEAFDVAVRELPESIELGLVAFRECRDIRTYGVFDKARRPVAVDAVRSLVPHGRTPLAESLRRAAELLDDGPSAIVMLTDGREFCGGDPCAAAAEIKSRHRETTIHVVDLGGQARTECVAAATGGRSYSPATADDLGRVLSHAFKQAVRCPALAATRGAASPPGAGAPLAAPR